MAEDRYADYDAFAWFYNRYWGPEFSTRAPANLEKLALPPVPTDGYILASATHSNA